MSSGRTVWQAQDAAWWRRERVVILGEEFGPAGPAVANWLECEAKTNASQDGSVKTGFSAIKRGAFLDSVNLAERIVALAVEIGFLRAYELGTGGRTFTAVVSAYVEDQPKGAAGLRKEAQRAREEVAERATQSAVDSVEAPAEGGSTAERDAVTSAVTDRDDVTSGHAPYAREERRGEKEEDDEDASTRLRTLHPDLPEVLSIFAAAPGIDLDETSAGAVASALRSRQDVPSLEVAYLVAAWAHEPSGLRLPLGRAVFAASRQIADRDARTAGIRDEAGRREASRGASARPRGRSLGQQAGMDQARRFEEMAREAEAAGR